jgi:adenosylcobinamide-phosphate synthase
LNFDPTAPWFVLAAALAFDIVIGEAPAALHPVVWIGRAISAAERRARTWAQSGPVRELTAGAVMAAGVPLVLLVVVAGCLDLLSSWAWAHAAALIFIVTSSFALRALRRAGLDMIAPLTLGDHDTAVIGLKNLCSRDGTPLSQEELAAATVESVAENASDSFVAPLFFYLLFGWAGMLAYRVVNTMDAMIGYRTPRHEYLGKAAARLDDLLNFIPSRLTALLLVAAGGLLRADARQGWTIWQRDGHRTPSPNAGQPMAAMAGLLHVQLSKRDAYSLGDAGQPVTPATIRKAVAIATLACALWAAVVLALLALQSAVTAG